MEVGTGAQHQEALDRKLAELAAAGIQDPNLANQLAVLSVHGGYCEKVAVSQNRELQETREAVQRLAQFSENLMTEVRDLRQAAAATGGGALRGGGGGGESRLKTAADLRGQVLKWLNQNPAVWTMDSNRTQDFELWKQAIEMKLKATAVDLTRDRAAINAYIWGLLDPRLQQAAADLRPHFFEGIIWHEYLGILEEKFAPANIRNFQIHVFKNRVQQRGETVLEFHNGLELAFHRAKFVDEHTFYDQFLRGCLNKELVKEICKSPKTKTIKGLREFLLTAQSSLLDVAKYLGDSKYTVGLTQLSTPANKYIQGLQKQRRQEEPMDLSSLAGDLLFLEGPEDQALRDEETEDIREYWEGEEELIMALATARGDPSGKTCYHCREKGHLKASCPQRRTGALERRREQKGSQGQGAGGAGPRHKTGGGPRGSRTPAPSGSKTRAQLSAVEPHLAPGQDGPGQEQGVQQEQTAASNQVF